MTVELSPRFLALAIAIALATAIAGLAAVAGSDDGRAMTVALPTSKTEGAGRDIAPAPAPAAPTAAIGTPSTAVFVGGDGDGAVAPADEPAPAAMEPTDDAPVTEAARSTGTSAPRAAATERATAAPASAPATTTVTTASAPTTLPPTLVGQLDRDIAARVVAHHNRERAGRGLAPLTRSSCLDGVAGAWATRLATGGQLVHNPSAPAQIEACMPWVAVGENIGFDGTVDAVTDAWMASVVHRTNILSSTFTHIGVGVVRKDGNLWVAVNFAG
jgi:uncharacterized protein YkwD